MQLISLCMCILNCVTVKLVNESPRNSLSCCTFSLLLSHLHSLHLCILRNETISSSPLLFSSLRAAKRSCFFIFFLFRFNCFSFSLRLLISFHSRRQESISPSQLRPYIRLVCNFQLDDLTLISFFLFSNIHTWLRWGPVDNVSTSPSSSFFFCFFFFFISFSDLVSF